MVCSIRRAGVASGVAPMAEATTGAVFKGSIGNQPSGGGEVAIRGFRFGRLFGIVCSTAPLFWVKPSRRRGLGPENAKIAGPVWPGAPNSFLNSRLRHAGSTPR